MATNIDNKTEHFSKAMGCVEVCVLTVVAKGRGVFTGELLLGHHRSPVADLAQAITFAERLVGHIQYGYLARTPAVLVVLHIGLDEGCVVGHNHAERCLNNQEQVFTFM